MWKCHALNEYGVISYQYECEMLAVPHCTTEKHPLSTALSLS